MESRLKWREVENVAEKGRIGMFGRRGTFAVAALIGILALPALARAEDKEKAGQAAGARKEHRAVLLKKFDKNGDGKLDATERAAMRSAVKQKVQARHAAGSKKPGAAGASTTEKTPPAIRKVAKGKSKAHRADILKKFDKNGNGKLDPAEKKAFLASRKAQILKKFDKNGDGKLDKAERQAMRKAHKASGAGSAKGTPAGGPKTLKV